ncbi:MAG: hypothetical protein FWD93_06150 [Coriobacteriia bacterium]|nr:hypothetical protein [Coriobacteriia bacterium]
MKKYLMLLLAILLAISVSMLVACDEAEPSNNADTTEASANDAGDEEPIAAISFGDTFTFDDLEITFGDDITWETLENQFSDLDGDDVFLVPITITNTSDETHGLNMFFYTQFGPDGNNLDTTSAFFDGDVAFAGDMRTGATQESFMSFHYVGDGDYVVEFNALFGDTTEVILPISK